MSSLRDLPNWVKTAIAVATILVSMALAWGDMKADLRVEVTERKASDSHIEKSVDEIKEMLKEEMDRHHPRK